MEPRILHEVHRAKLPQREGGIGKRAENYGTTTQPNHTCSH